MNKRFPKIVCLWELFLLLFFANETYKIVVKS